ncbi:MULTISPECIES: ATP-binding protein [Chryseobacterium]|uniref:histidine kinase n=1 Tax=Chryseobacterium camelliae TaxID=1265445 RepID=A0ABU0TDR3_9FLAO|nr:MULTISPECIES: ATP-binding protein [Chryseobacterium]MDT3406995.1 chemotaxis family two-component system sensor kinase Cph1 [Pseudacidovorax intermedius]MDQ1095213.1 chemotaxis family two-component system sensor kinase Cph1 [Chryseobacterium camelliae]MDQ1099151.1 chemotaxis family two-component system sensor kinase Cph1 [Chryseobacterium sp. SORGH_AS_1048]MDR6086500.1 chemotaxis family two-component system sensor kinase Cph1 [Chryseobacterium sp. SORGH_AS_0909]MDR6130871.1 chemotaxis family
MNFVQCHEEPIHIPGCIQSFGYLIGIDAESRSITFISGNIADIFVIESIEALFGRKVTDFPQSFHSIIKSDIYNSLDNFTRRENETYFDKIFINGIQYHFSVFRSDNNIFLEFEEVIFNPNKRISNKYDSFYIMDNAQEIWEQLLNTLAPIINYDRMMIYKFMMDGSGKVIAEKKKDHVESYLGLHYPESDIPRQARELYMKKRKRIFSNVYAETVPVLSRDMESIDLTFTTSRAMSPIHGQYIKNSGASSSFSVSIVIDDHLWGLVTCQNTEPKHIDLEDRVQAGIFTALASNAYSSFKSKNELQYRLSLNEKTSQLKEQLLQDNNIFDVLADNKSELACLPEADGLAIISDEHMVTEGSIPDRETVGRIADWALANIDESIYVNRSFLKDHGKDLALDEKAAGVIIYCIEKSKKELLIWFRREFDEHISWGGKPEKKIELFVQNGEEKYIVSPRTSFHAFTESIKGNSKRWNGKNVSAVNAVRDVILEISHKNYNTIKSLNDELKKVNEELDSFSYTISHDLGTPLTVMKLNAQMLLNTLTDGSEKSRAKIKAIINEIDGMADMMNDVLQLSRAKHTDIVLESIPTAQTIEKISENAKITFESPKSKIIIKACPEVMADKTLLHQVFLNIINNAVKYSSTKEQPVVEIDGVEDGEFVVYRISDNGIGIPEEEKHRMFKIFNRMVNARKFKGNGVGLSIVHRIMKRIGGSVEYESNDEGTTFILKFKNPKLEEF